LALGEIPSGSGRSHEMLPPDRGAGHHPVRVIHPAGGWPGFAATAFPRTGSPAADKNRRNAAPGGGVTLPRAWILVEMEAQR